MTENLILYGFSGNKNCERKNLEEIVPSLKNSEIVLMEDGVLGITKSSGEFPYSSIINKISKIYCLKEDLLARGMEPEKIMTGIAVIDYGELIDLIEKSRRIISWL